MHAPMNIAYAIHACVHTLTTCTRYSKVTSCYTEEDVFVALGLDYKAPHERSLDETTIGSMMQQGAHQGNEQVSKHCTTLHTIVACTH
jgi:hypothetical protein